jgi:membrane glycosyltransferase
MLTILRADGLSVLEAVVLAPFVITFTWIAIAFWSSVIGCVFIALRRDPMSLGRLADTSEATAIGTRTAVAMPVYNEDVARVAAGLEANIAALERTGQGGCFDVYLLSDSTDDAIAEAERRACGALRERLGDGVRLFYRRRDDNTGRKAGNIADFCRRWGDYYDYMIVLDADSLMTGDAMLNLVRGMQANPSAGLIQTVPLPVRSRTFFGRFLQFAATLHSPVLAAGFSFWQTDAANYWGHNAILRISAFRECCGLPELPGRAPLGGEILSHDFVEAALLRRGGWHCYLFSDIQGSYEEVPSNMLDFAKRDRRWTQGNLQHLKVLPARGLHPLSRLHMGMGVLAFSTSLLWLVMLGLSTVDAVWRAVDPEGFFTRANQLFPDWPVSRPGLMGWLLLVTVIVLVLPKLLCLALGLLRERRGYGGAAPLLASGVAELAFSVLIAPIMMVFHSSFVIGVLAGGRVNWTPQAREGRMLAWGEAVRRSWPATLMGLAWGSVTWTWAPQFFWWLSPVLVGLVFAAPLIRVSSSPGLGDWVARLGLFRTPAQGCPPAVISHLERALAAPALAAEGDVAVRPLLPERRREMPVQSLRARNGATPPVPVGSARLGGDER